MAESKTWNRVNVKRKDLNVEFQSWRNIEHANIERSTSNGEGMTEVMGKTEGVRMKPKVKTEEVSPQFKVIYSERFLR